MKTEKECLTPIDNVVKVGDFILYSEASYSHVMEGQIMNVDFPIIEIEQDSGDQTMKCIYDLTKITILRILTRG